MAERGNENVIIVRSKQKSGMTRSYQDKLMRPTDVTHGCVWTGLVI